jgi:hypothetical protein
MDEKTQAQVFPRRDADGRVISLRELLIAVFVGALIGLAALAVIDGVFSLIGFGAFGGASGWLAVLLPLFLFVDDFRAWRVAGGWRRVVAALVAMAIAIPVGLTAAWVASGLPPIVSGAVGAAVLALAYAVIWFVWIRWVTGSLAEGGAR